MPFSHNNSYASTLKNLHKPGDPIVFANIYDTESARALLALNNKHSSPIVKGVATASFAIAAKLSLADEDLSLEQNLAAAAEFSPIVRAAGIPLSIDLQDGYGDRIVEAVTKAISIGAVGANIEDSYPNKGFADGIQCLRSIEEAADRIRLALKTAEDLGVPDFVVNARTDVLRLTPAPSGWTRETLLEEAFRRGKAYLDAGATCIFIWGGAAGPITTQEVQQLVSHFQGRLAVKLGAGKDSLSVRELTKIGVCRTSVGPSLMPKDGDMEVLQKNAERILLGGQLWDATGL